MRFPTISITDAIGINSEENSGITAPVVKSPFDAVGDGFLVANQPIAYAR